MFSPHPLPSNLPPAAGPTWTIAGRQASHLKVYTLVQTSAASHQPPTSQHLTPGPSFTASCCHSNRCWSIKLGSSVGLVWTCGWPNTNHPSDTERLKSTSLQLIRALLGPSFLKSHRLILAGEGNQRALGFYRRVFTAQTQPHIEDLFKNPCASGRWWTLTCV